MLCLINLTVTKKSSGCVLSLSNFNLISIYPIFCTFLINFCIFLILGGVFGVFFVFFLITSGKKSIRTEECAHSHIIEPISVHSFKKFIVQLKPPRTSACYCP